MSNRYAIAARAIENLAALARRRQPIRMATDGPRDGDVNDAGLVFYDHRWRRKEEVPAGEKAGGKQSESGTDSTPVAKWAAKRFKDPAHAKAFVKWFGDSKVVDDKGEPLVVYHGTDAKDFDTFDTTTSELSHWTAHLGSYFTSDPDVADMFTGRRKQRIIPTFLSIRKPYVISADKWEAMLTQKQSASMYGENRSDKARKWKQRLQDNGYDGIVIPPSESHPEMKGGMQIAFHPHQIKSATGNRGTFDPDDPKITMATWTKYEGPRGGNGWRNTATGDVLYQDEMPSEHEAAEPSKKQHAPLDFSKSDYTAITLDRQSRKTLLKTFAKHLPKGWQVFGDHVTLHSGPPEESESGERKLRVVGVGRNDRVIAVEVDDGSGKMQHITLAVNRSAGARPREAGDIKKFKRLDTPLDLVGSAGLRQRSEIEEKAAAKKRAKVRALRATKHLKDHELIGALAKRDDPSLYFKTEHAVLMPVSKLTNIRARPEGIANAARFMYAAALGKMPKRGPVSVMKTADGYQIYDGNSTFNIAKQAGWKNLPVQFVDSDGKPIAKSRLEIEREKMPKTFRSRIVKRGVPKQARPRRNENGEIFGYHPVTHWPNGEPLAYGEAPDWLLEQPISTTEKERYGSKLKAIEARKKKGRPPVILPDGIAMSTNTKKPSLSTNDLTRAVSALEKLSKLKLSRYPIKMEAGRAPAGGVNINGEFYVGGQFIPGTTQEEVDNVLRKQLGDDGGTGDRARVPTGESVRKDAAGLPGRDDESGTGERSRSVPAGPGSGRAGSGARPDGSGHGLADSDGARREATLGSGVKPSKSAPATIKIRGTDTLEVAYDGKTDSWFFHRPPKGLGAKFAPKDKSWVYAGGVTRQMIVDQLLADQEAHPKQPAVQDVVSKPPTRQTPTDCSAGNYRYQTRDFAKGGLKQKFNQNIAALKTLQTMRVEGRTKATAEEQETLSKFVGWGAFPALFNDNWAGDRASKEREAAQRSIDPNFIADKWKSEREILRSVLSDEEFQSSKGSILNAHFTAPDVVDAHWKMAQKLGFNGGRFLETSAGIGYYLGMMPPELAKKTHSSAVELDQTTGNMLKAMYPATNVQVTGFEKLAAPPNFYDLVASNVPFGNYGIHDPKYNKHNPLIHDYFFLKSADLAAPGGLVMHITSTGTMDKPDSKIRKELMKSCDIVGAVRFPGGAHQENAGTAVVTDMIILRKRHPGEEPVGAETPSEAEPKGPGFTGITTDSLGRLYHWKDGVRVPGPKWDDVVEVPDPDGGDPIEVNRYFADNPQHILGRLDRSGTMYHAGNDNVSLVGPQELSEALGRSVVVHVTDDGKRRFVFEDDGSLVPSATIRDIGMPIYRKKLDDFIETLPEGAFAPNRASKAAFQPDVMPAPGDVKEGGYKIQDGKLYQRRGGALVEQQVNSKVLARIAGQLPILDATRGVINSQIGDVGELSSDAARAKLNEVYDAYVAEHGYLSTRENRRAMMDAGDDFHLLQSLEKWNAAEGTATKRDIFNKDTIRRETTFDHADSVADGFTISLHEKAGVDVDYIAQLTGKTVDEVAMGLSDAGIAFEDPETGWTAADIYLSGNVRKKLMMAQAAAAADPRYQINVDALLKVQPEDKDYTEIGAKLGAVWIPPSDVAAFAAHLIGARQTPSDLFDVFHAPGVGWQARWTAKGAKLYRDSAAATETWGTSDNNVMTLLEAALTGKQVVVKGSMDERIEDDGTVVEFPAVGVDRNGDPVDIVNRKATEDAAAKIQEIKDEFKDWIWDDDARTERLARYYNDNFNNIRDIDYDGSHLTFPGMNPAINLHPHIKDFVWQVVNNGTALAGHEVGVGKTYAMIASAMELRRLGLAKKPAIACLKSNIDQITADVHELYPGAKVLSTADMFDAKKRKQTLAQIATGDYDLVVMTHDHLNKLNMKPEVEAAYIREEIQELENAKRTAEAEGGKKNNRAVKSLETAKKNLEKRLQQALDKKYSDDAIFFEESGIDELFIDESHFFKSLPVWTKLQRVKGIPTGRSDRATNMLMRTRWIREQNGGRGVVFASGTPIDNTMAELYNNQRYLQPEELKERGINSFDDWANTFGEITTRHEFSVAGEYKPTTRFSTFTNVGNLMNITRQMLDVQRAEDLKRPDGSLVIKRPKRHDVAVVSPKSQAIEDLMTDLARRAEAIKKRRGPAQKGDDNMLVICTDGRKGALDMRLLDDTAPDDPNSKTNKCVDQVLKLHKARPDQAQIIFSDLGVNPQKNATTKDESVTDNNEQDSANLGSTGKFRLYDDIINKLVAGGIPRDQIADFSTLEGAKKQEAMARIRRGEIKVAIGSTKKLGTGTNVQTKIMAMHHLDVPWTPASVEQRDGRGWRHGNENWDHPEGIKVHRYITEGSLDQKFWSIISTKARFTKQIMTSQDRNLNEIEEEDTEVLSPEHLMAIASGDQRIMKKIEIEDSVKKLRSAGSRHRRQQQKFKKAVSNHGKSQEESAKEITQYKQDAEKLAEVPDFKLALGDVSYDKRPEAAEALAARVARIDQRFEGQYYMDETVGQYRGMKLKRKKMYRQAPYYTLTGPSGNEYTTGDSLQSIEYVARNLDKKRQDLENEMKRADQDIETVKAKMGTPFKQSKELEKLESELREIEDDLTGKTAKKQAREAAVETLAMGLRAELVTVHRLPPRDYAVVATALERLLGATKMSLDRQIRMGQDDGPREGDVNDAGLVFHNHRWRRKEDGAAAENPERVAKQGKSSGSLQDLIVDHNQRGLDNSQRKPEVEAAGFNWKAYKRERYGPASAAHDKPKPVSEKLTRKPTLERDIADLFNSVGAEDGGVEVYNLPSEWRDDAATWQAEWTDKTIEELISRAKVEFKSGGADSFKQAIKNVASEMHADSWYQEEDRRRTELQDRELQEWMDRNGNQQSVASQIERSLPGIDFSQAAGGSWYGTYRGVKIRISDHRQKSGGGFNQSTGDRMGESDIQIIVDYNGPSEIDIAKLRRTIARKLRYERDGDEATPSTMSVAQSSAMIHMSLATTAYNTLARVFERLIPPIQMALDNRITMAVKQTWTPFTTKAGRTGAYNAASGKRLYGKEAEQALAQKKPAAPDEQKGGRRGAKTDDATGGRAGKPEESKKFRNAAEAEQHVRKNLPGYAKKQGKTVPELAKSLGFTDEKQLIKTSAASKAAGFKTLKEASAAKNVSIGAKLSEAFGAGDKPKDAAGGKEPFVETPEQVAKQSELEVNELPRIDMPQLYDQAKIDFIAKLKKNGVRVDDQDIPATKLTGLQSEYKPDKVHGIAGAMAAGAKIGGGRAMVTSDGYVIDGHHRWRASHQADQPVEATVIDMPAHKLIDAIHRFKDSERRTVSEALVSKATGFGPKMANYLHSKLDPVMQKALDPQDFRLPIDYKQPMQTEDEVIEVAKQNLEDYNRILDFGLGVSKSIGATAVNGGKEGEFAKLLDAVDSGSLKGPFVLIAPLKTDSAKGLDRARQKVAANYGGDWSQLKDVVRGTIAVDSYDDLPAAVNALREHSKSKGWTVTMRPESRFDNPTKAGYRDLQMFIRSPDGLAAEVQVNTKAMWVAKEKYGHKLFEEARELAANIKLSPDHPDNKKRQSRIDELDKQMEELYSKAWEESRGSSMAT